MINTVSKGEPIRATWANSIALELNHPNGLNLRSKRRAENYSRPMQYASEPAFQIRTTSNYNYTLNTGQIYIDGELVEASENNQDSYNQVGSIDNWEALSFYTPISEKDFPIWTILIYKLAIEEAAVGDEETPPPYKASLSVKSFDGSQSPKTVPTPDNYYLWKSIPVNEVDEEHSELKQLVSGSIYLSTIEQPSIIITDGISIIAGDGINVHYDDGAYTISAKLSVIPTDDFIAVNQYTDTSGTIMVELGKGASAITADPISLVQGTNIILSKNTANNSYTINGYRTYVEAGKNVDIDSKFSQNSTTYTISAKCIQSIIAGDGLFVSKIDDDGIYIALGDGGTPESKIEIDGIITTDGNYRTWDTIGNGSMGVNLAHLQIGTSTYNLHMEILTDSNYKKFLKFSF